MFRKYHWMNSKLLIYIRGLCFGGECVYCCIIATPFAYMYKLSHPVWTYENEPLIGDSVSLTEVSPFSGTTTPQPAKGTNMNLNHILRTSPARFTPVSK